MKPIADPSLPGLSTALDADAVVEVLRREMPELREDYEILSAELEDVQYQPGTKCLFLYGLTARDRRSGLECRQMITAQLLRRNESPEAVSADLQHRYEQCLQGRKDSNQGFLRRAVVYAEDLRVMFYAFPVDPVLGSLLEALDMRRMKQHLARAWVDAPFAMRSLRGKPIVYTPQARVSLMYKVSGEAPGSGQRQRLRLIGKMNARKEPAALYADALALWHAADGRVGLARPIAYLAPLRMTLQGFVEGRRLTDFTTAPEFLEKIDMTAVAAAGLHGLRAPLHTYRPPQVETRFVERQTRILQAVRPDLSADLERFAGRLIAQLESRVAADGPVHGDLHSANVLIDGDRLTLIDLDQAAYGDTAADIGRFLASLRSRSLRQWGDHTRLSGARDVFLVRYLQETGRDERKIRLFEAAWLLHGAKYLFEIQWPNWQHQVDLLFDEAQLIFQAAGAGSKSVPSVRRDNERLAFRERTRWATDRAYMQAVFTPIVEQLHGVSLRACRSATIKACDDSHAQIRYRLSGRIGKEAWRRRFIGHLWHGRSGRGVLRRLTHIDQVLSRCPQAPKFSRVAAYVSALSMLVLEVPAGRRFSALAGTPEAAQAADDLAAALAALHGSALRLGRRSSLQDRLRATRERIAALAGQSPAIQRRAERLFGELARDVDSFAERSVPVIRAVRFDRIFWAGDQIAFAGVHDLSLSHPLLDVGDFLARTELFGLKEGQIHGMAEVARRFRAGYLAAQPFDVKEVSVFLSLALLRAACVEAKQGAGDSVAERVLQRAEDCLLAA